MMSYRFPQLRLFTTSLTVANLAMGMYDSIGLLWGQVINGYPLIWTRVLSHGESGIWAQRRAVEPNKGRDSNCDVML